MKTAVCLYGLPRGNKYTWTSLVNSICEPLEADLFIHTWMLKEQILTHTGLPQPSRLEAMTLASFFFKRYSRTKSVSIEYQQQHSPITIPKPWGLVYWSNQVNMFLSLSRVSFISRELDCYDAIIFTRPDIYFKERISVQTLNDLSDGLSHGGIKQKNVGIDFDDVFFIVKNKNPSDIFNLILQKYSSNYFQNNDIYNIIPNQCAELNMAISKIDYQYGSSFYIQRPYSIMRIKNAVFRRFKSLLKI